MVNDAIKRLSCPDDRLVWDNHGCVPLNPTYNLIPHLERYRRAGVTVLSLGVAMSDMCSSDVIHVLSTFCDAIIKQSARFRLVATTKDVALCRKDGKLGITFDIEGMDPAIGSPGLVQAFYKLGVRWMLIAYNRNNAAGGGCLDQDCGLTEVGRAIITEMERVGMVLCLSHAGPRTVAEAIDYANNPPIFSHSNPAGDTQHPRNISDELIRACAAKGGVIGLSGIGPFLGGRDMLVAHLLRQLHYVIDLVGTDHVGLGLDYEADLSDLGARVRANPATFAPGVTSDLALLGPEAFAEIADGLARSGLSDAAVAAVLGGNWLRIAEKVWR